MAKDKWVTVTRHTVHGDKLYTKRVSELSENEIKHRAIRPARPREIKAALDTELEQAEILRRRAAFRERPDYKDAEAIRAMLELMEPDQHPLNALSPKQWAELRQALAMANGRSCSKLD